MERPGGAIQPFLGCGGYYIAFPGVDGEVYGADAAYGIDEEEPVVGAGDLGDGAKRVSYAGRGLVVGYENCLDGGVIGKMLVHVIGVYGFAVGRFESMTTSAPKASAICTKAITERAYGHRASTRSPGRECVDHRGFHGPGARTGHDVEIVFGLEELLETGSDPFQDFFESRAPMVDHLGGHSLKDFLGDMGWGPGCAGGPSVFGIACSRLDCSRLNSQRKRLTTCQ